MIRWIAHTSVHRPVTVVMGFIALLVLGSIAWSRVPLEMMPGTFTLNRMWVWMPFQNSTPRETERQVVRPVEDHLSSTPGLKSMNTTASQNGGRVSLEFHRSIKMDAAYNAVVDRMERAMADLPDEVDKYWVYRWNPSDEPIMWGGLSIPDEVEDAHWIVTEVIQKSIERVSGVGKVDVWGVHPKRVFIDFDLDLLRSHGVSLYEVVGKLSADNFQLASGRVVDGGLVRYVRSLARYEDLDTLKNHPVKPGVRLSDIGTVRYRPDPSPYITQIEGNDGVAIGVYKESGANTVAVTEAIHAAMEALQAEKRLQGIKFVTFFDQGDIIQQAVDNLTNTAMWGGFFAIIVLFAFLRDWRMTLLIAACIPFTLMLTVMITYFTGRTLNLLSLMGLMLAVGMVVDNSIVVAEAIHVRKHAGGSLDQSAVEGTNDVGLAIVLSTLTTMVVFLPIILMSGNADFSFFMSELGMPVVWALAASLVVALVFTPLTTTLIRRSKKPVSPMWIAWLERRYRQGLSWILAHRSDALVGVIGLTLLTVVVPLDSVGCKDDASGNVGEFVIRSTVPGSYTWRDRKDLVDQIDAFVAENKEKWGVRTWNTRMRSTSSRARTFVYLDADRSASAMGRKEVIADVEAHLPEIPGVRIHLGWGDSGGPKKNTVRLLLEGEDTRTLESLGDEVQRVLSRVEGVVDVVSDMEEEGGREIRLDVDRDATARYGVRPSRIGQTVGFALRGTALPDFQDGDKEIDVVARFRLEDRRDLNRLLDFPMWSQQTMGVVPLRALTNSTYAQGLGSIHRENRITSYPIQVDLEDGLDKDDAWQRIDAALGNLALPRGYKWSRPNRHDQQENDHARNMAMLLSVTFVFLIMGVLFESFLLPLSIITTIPMAFLGVYWTLYFTGTPLDMMGAVGMVILVGVVVNNGIVYIDLVTRLRRDGCPRSEALVEAGGRRLRPILMTALTTIFGVLPMAVGEASFVGMPYAPIGRVVAGGLAAGTLLTLFFLPFLYTVLDDARGTISRWWAWVVGPSKEIEVAK
jgi:HAE1 family hydrophobic/amphiphilic exporter-1